MSETNRQRWRRDGTRDFVALEARPPRNDRSPSRYQLVIEATPDGDLGACDAMQALVGAWYRCAAQPKEFWRSLRVWAEAQGR